MLLHSAIICIFVAELDGEVCKNEDDSKLKL